MGGYIGSSVGNVANAAERKQTYSITTSTTSLTGLAYTPTKVHVFHNGVRLVDGTDYTATNGTSITLTNAAQNGDEVVVISYPSFQTSDTVSAANGGTFAGNVDMSGTLGVTGATTLTGSLSAKGGAVFNEDSADVDFRVESDNDANAFFVQGSDGNVGIGTSSPSTQLHITPPNNTTANKITQSFGSARADGNDVIAGGFDSEFVTRDGNVNTGAFIRVIDTNTNGSFPTTIRGGVLSFGTVDGTTSSSADATERMRITSAGTIGTGSIAANNINNTIAFTSTGNGTHADHFYSHGPHFTSDDPAYYVINHASVGVYLPYGNNSWSAHSDERIKENITSLENVLPNIENLRCVKYNLKGQSETKIGFIAQDWEANFGEVVDENSRQVIENNGTVAMDSDSESTTKVKGMSYTETIPVLLKAIQEQQEEIKTLKTKVAALEAK